MDVSLSYRGGRFLPLLAMACIVTALPAPAHADLFTSRLTDRASFAPIGPSASGSTARVVYESAEEKKPEVPDGKRHSPRMLTALTLILIVPAGTLPVGFGTSSQPLPPPPSPPHISSSSPPSTAPGGGTIGGGGSSPSSGTPEPGTLLLMLTGCGTTLLGWLRRACFRT